jgi:hypothetical protein
LALTAVSPKSKLANSMVRFIVVAFLVAFFKMDALSELRVAPFAFAELELQSCAPELLIEQ